MGKLQYRWHEGPTVTLITIDGELQLEAVIDELKPKVLEAIANGRNLFVVHLNIPWVNSIGLGVLMTVLREIMKSGCRLIVVHVPKLACPGPVRIVPEFEMVSSLAEAAEMLGVGKYT